MLPAGPLREPAARLDEVDFVFINGESNDRDGRRFALRAGAVHQLGGTASRVLDDFRGYRVWAVAGIGNPARFLSTLREAGVDPELVDVPDHGTVSLDALHRERAWPILMTAKDAVKYRSKPVGDAWYVTVDVEMPRADESALLERLRKLYVER